MDEKQLVEALKSMLSSSDSEESTFFFPRNVDSTYKIAAGMNFKEIFKYIGPALVAGILVMLIPPYSNIAMIIIKLFLICLFFCIGLLFAFLKPIPSRPNITLRKFLKNYFDFMKKQKVYFRRKKEGMFTNNEKRS